VRRHPETGERRLDLLRWEPVPHFTKDLKDARRPINARAETVVTSGMFRGALASRRCPVPADAFFEWAGHGGRNAALRHRPGRQRAPDLRGPMGRLAQPGRGNAAHLRYHQAGAHLLGPSGRRLRSRSMHPARRRH
jgi:hypothetical protein